MTRGSGRGPLRIGLAALALLGAAPTGPLGDPAAPDARAQGDAAWEARARGERDGRADPAPIQASIRAYQRALEARPDDLEARWKLLRSLHFAGTFASRDEAEQRRTFERATRLSDAALERLARRVGDEPPLEELEPDALRARLAAEGVPARGVARLYFWTAINWGGWTQTVGLLSAVQQGVANRLRRYARVTLALEPAYEDGGAYRLLGRLHASLPRVPFLTGWVDRKRALPLIERGHRLAPDHPGNQLLLALTLLEQAPEQRPRALELLGRVAELRPRPAMRVEDLAIREEARARLAETRTALTRR